MLEGQGLKGKRGAQWFYSLPENDNFCASADKIYKDYLGAKEFGNIFSLDVGPDRNGRIRKIDEETLKKVGQYIRGEVGLKPEIKATASGFWQNDGNFGAAKAFDGDKNTRWGAAENSKNGWLEIDSGVEKSIKKAVIDEAGFNRIQKYEIQAKVNGEWKTVASGATLGSPKEIEFTAPVKAQVFRLNLLEATEVPTISEFQLFE